MSCAPQQIPKLDELATQFERIRGATDLAPDASIVIPVNAQGDLSNVLNLLNDLSAYTGNHLLETILVINNYPPQNPPPEVDTYRLPGIKVVAVPSTRKPGVVAPLSSRIRGVEAAVTDLVILFDADCRINSPNDLIDWYIQQYKSGAKLAYTHVNYYDLSDHWSIRFRIRAHHLARWVKRTGLRIPTSRGSNYAVDRKMMLALYAEGYLADDLNVGPAFRSKGAQIAYSNEPSLCVLTSGRMFTPRRIDQLGRYFWYRLRYNIRVLPVRKDAHLHTGRIGEPARRYVNGKPMIGHSDASE